MENTTPNGAMNGEDPESLPMPLPTDAAAGDCGPAPEDKPPADEHSDQKERVVYTRLILHDVAPTVTAARVFLTTVKKSGLSQQHVNVMTMTDARRLKTRELPIYAPPRLFQVFAKVEAACTHREAVDAASLLAARVALLLKDGLSVEDTAKFVVMNYPGHVRHGIMYQKKSLPERRTLPRFDRNRLLVSESDDRGFPTDKEVDNDGGCQTNSKGKKNKPAKGAVVPNPLHKNASDAAAKEPKPTPADNGGKGTETSKKGNGKKSKDIDRKKTARDQSPECNGDRTPSPKQTPPFVRPGPSHADDVYRYSEEWSDDSGSLEDGNKPVWSDNDHEKEKEELAPIPDMKGAKRKGNHTAVRSRDPAKKLGIAAFKGHPDLQTSVIMDAIAELTKKVASLDVKTGKRAFSQR